MSGKIAPGRAFAPLPRLGLSEAGETAMSVAIAYPSRTIINKGRDGWEQKTQIELGTIDGKERVLVIETGKGYRGGLRTTATMHTVESSGFLSFRMSMSMAGGGKGTKAEGDFRETVKEEVARTTEKAVNVQHALVMDDVEAIIARAIAFYA
jgi:hypothetical protein